MRVLRVLTRMNVGGPARAAIALTEALLSRGDETLVLAGCGDNREGDLADEVDADFPFVRIPTLGRSVAPFRDARALFEIVRCMRSFRPDVVHTHAAKAGTLGRLATTFLRPRPRVVHTFHGHVLSGNFSPRVSRAYARIERALARRTDRLVTVSPRVRDELRDRFGIGRAEQWNVIPGGAEPCERPLERGEARRALDLPDEAVVIGVVARLARVKGHDVLLDALSRIADPPRILLLGDGPLRCPLEERVRREGRADTVRFAGWVRPPRQYVRAFDAVLLPSRQEGLPLALLEAMQEGVPVIATDVGGVADLVADGVEGLLVAPEDPDALARAIVNLVSSRERRKEMGERAREKAAPYTLERHVARVISLYDDAVGGLP